MEKKLFFGVLVCISLLLTSCSEKPDPTQAEPKQTIEKSSQSTSICQLTMGWDPWEPYQYLTPENTLAGLDVELLSAFAQQANCEIKFVQKNWMNLLNGVRSGTIDILGGASKTKAREAFALFSENYRHESFVLYIRAEESEKYANKSLQQLLDSNFRLGITQDYIYGDMVSGLQDDLAYVDKLVTVPTTEVNYFNLMQNNIDGFLEDPFVAAYTIKRKGLQQQIAAHAIEVHSGDVAIMFSKKSVPPEIVEAFNSALVSLKQSGEYQKILSKYSR